MHALVTILTHLCGKKLAHHVMFLYLMLYLINGLQVAAVGLESRVARDPGPRACDARHHAEKLASRALESLGI